MRPTRHLCVIATTLLLTTSAIAQQPEAEAEAEAEAEPEAEAEAEPEAEPDAEAEADAEPDAETPPHIFLPSQCQSYDVGAALAKTQASIARVQAPGASGLGFVFYSSDYIVTALSIVDRGRGIRVSFDDGVVRDGTVVAMDRGADIAIVELESAAPAAPLQLTPARLSVGDPVLAIGTTTHRWAGRKDYRRKLRKRRRGHGHKWRDNSEKVVHPGTVTWAKGDRLRTDSLDSRNLSWGAPLLDCAGRVVGVATTPFSDEVISAERVRALEDEIADGPIYAGGWSMGHGSIALVGQADHLRNETFDEHDFWLGLSVGTALIGNDRWYFPARFTATWLVGPDYEDPDLDRTGYRLAGSLGAGYRIMLRGGNMPFYLVPQIGFNLNYEKLTLETTELFVQTDCGNATCPVERNVFEESTDGWRAMPTAGLGLQWGFGELSYQFLLDPRNLENSIHQWSIGAQW